MSSTRGFLKPYKIIDNQPMSGNLTSSVTSINYLDNVSVECNFTDNSVNAQGTFFVEGSLSYHQDTNENVTNQGSWTPIVLSPVPVANGAPGTVLIDMNQLSFPWIRVRYVAVSGGGPLDVYVSAKQI